MGRRTWIDVTDLVAWEGPSTGIQRVTRNLVSRYARLPDVGLFVFSDASQTFKEVDATAVLAPEARDVGEQRDAGWGASAGSRGVVRRLVRRSMPVLRRRVPHPAKRAIRRAEAQGRALRASLAGALRRGVHRIAKAGGDAWVVRRGTRMVGALRRSISFNPGDRVLVLGQGWAAPSLQAALAHQKRINGIEVYQVLYDLTPILLPQCFGPGFPEAFTRYLFDALAVSDGMIAISAHSRSDALRFCEDLRIPPPPIEVFRLGDEISGNRREPEPVRQLEGSAFILSVGTFESRKNHLLLYQVWKLAQERGRRLPKLVIVGRVGWAAGDTLDAIARDPLVRDLIHVLDDVSDSQLSWLYDSCLFTVYPSLYEGWGLPVAESLARGKLCLASSASALPEVAGDLIDYFSPYSSSECLALIERYLDPPVLEAKVRQIGLGYKTTSWDEAFIDFEAALNRARSGRSGQLVVGLGIPSARLELVVPRGTRSSSTRALGGVARVGESTQLALIAAATAMWIWCAVQLGTVLVSETHPLNASWLYDWNVYHAAARDLVDRTLYRIPLLEPGFSLPLAMFNYPALAAVWIVPFLALDRESGGLVFVLVNQACLVAGLFLALRTLGAHRVWLWGALIAAIYLATWPLVRDQLGLANNNDVVFFLVALFAVAHLTGRQRTAGVLLALAIGTKLWPVAIAVLLLRERRWPELRWTAAGLAVQVLATMAWLGPDVVPFVVNAALLSNGPRYIEGIPMLWTSAARVTWAWWPAWATYGIAAVLMLVPATGRLGLGLAIVAGLSLNTNLWYHYVWAFALGAGLVTIGAAEVSLARIRGRDDQRAGAVLAVADKASTNAPGLHDDLRGHEPAGGRLDSAMAGRPDAERVALTEQARD